MADAGDLKSPVATLAGSNPAPGTKLSVHTSLAANAPLRDYSKRLAQTPECVSSL